MTEDTIGPARTPVAVKLALVVGNGFTLDCLSRLGLQGLDVSRPVNWPLQIPSQPELELRDALPNFFQAYDQLRDGQPDANQFDLLREIVGTGEAGENTARRSEVETRHFLTLAYRFLSEVLWTAPVASWHWLHWLSTHGHLLVTTVSFNYDCLLEQVLHRIGRQYHRMHDVTPGIVRVFKPHGSADFDLEGLVGEPLSYPLRCYGHMNNCPLRIVPGVEWGRPPSEPLIVLPHERNPYMGYQWAAPGYSIFHQTGPHLTHCVFAGLSYHPADRPEIDHFLYSTSKTCRIIIANPDPPKDFVNAIRVSGRELFVWLDGPEPLPIG